MEFTQKEVKSRDPDWLLFQSLEPLIRSIGMALIELSVYRPKTHSGSRRALDKDSEGDYRSRKQKDAPAERSGSVTIKAVVYKDGVTGIDDCYRAHRLILTRLDVVFPDRDVSLEVSSPGIDRVIKYGSEFVHYIGRGVRCYRTDISDWSSGSLVAADEKGIIIRGEKGEIALDYKIIAKAQLDGMPLADYHASDAPVGGSLKNNIGG